MKLFDRQKKWEINLYSYYDHAGIVRHLEDMARQGWETVSFTVTGSAKGILLLRSEEARKETCPDSVTEEEEKAAE